MDEKNANCTRNDCSSRKKPDSEIINAEDNPEPNVPSEACNKQSCIFQKDSNQVNPSCPNTLEEKYSSEMQLCCGCGKPMQCKNSSIHPIPTETNLCPGSQMKTTCRWESLGKMDLSRAGSTFGGGSQMEITNSAEMMDPNQIPTLEEADPSEVQLCCGCGKPMHNKSSLGTMQPSQMETTMGHYEDSFGTMHPIPVRPPFNPCTTLGCTFPSKVELCLGCGKPIRNTNITFGESTIMKCIEIIHHGCPFKREAPLKASFAASISIGTNLNVPCPNISLKSLCQRSLDILGMPEIEVQLDGGCGTKPSVTFQTDVPGDGSVVETPSCCCNSESKKDVNLPPLKASFAASISIGTNLCAPCANVSLKSLCKRSLDIFGMPEIEVQLDGGCGTKPSVTFQIDGSGGCSASVVETPSCCCKSASNKDANLVEGENEGDSTLPPEEETETPVEDLPSESSEMDSGVPTDEDSGGTDGTTAVGILKTDETKKIACVCDVDFTLPPKEEAKDDCLCE